MSLFDEGGRILEERTARPCFGVFPYVGRAAPRRRRQPVVAARPRTPAPPGARLAIVRFPHMSNATDFRLLTWADWITAPRADRYDFIILPGSKNTIADLSWLRDAGLADWILEQHQPRHGDDRHLRRLSDAGRTIHDPAGMESSAGEAEGLGLIPAVTMSQSRETDASGDCDLARRRPVRRLRDPSRRHDGRSGDEVTPFARLDDGGGDGIRGAGVVGTYLHGAFEHPDVCAEVFGIDAPSAISKAEQYQGLAAWFEQHARHLDRLGLD